MAHPLPPLPLPALLERLDAAQGGRERRRLAAALLQALARAEATPGQLHALLAHPGLAALRDGRGRSVRAAAVQALLARGYPHALEVTPEDLSHARQEARRSRGRPVLQGLALLALAGALLVGLLGLLFPGLLGGAAAAVLVSGLAGSALLLGGLAWARPARYLPAPAGSPPGPPRNAGDVRRVD